MVNLRIFQIPKDLEPSGYLVAGLEGNLLKSLASEDVSLTFYTYSSGSGREVAVVDYLQGELAGFKDSEKVDGLELDIQNAEDGLKTLSSDLDVTKFWNWYLPWRKGPLPRHVKSAMYFVELVSPLAVQGLWQDGEYGGVALWSVGAVVIPVVAEVSRRRTRKKCLGKIDSTANALKKYQGELVSERKKHSGMYATAEDVLARPRVKTVYVPSVLDVIKEARRLDERFVDVNWGKVRDVIRDVYLRANR